MTARSVIALAITLYVATVVWADPVKITHGPVVEHTGSHDATIAWSTNSSSATIVRYGTHPDHLGDLTEMPWGALTHRVTLNHLQPGTTYYFQADSSDGDATDLEGASPVEKFTTPAEKPADAKTSPPVQLRLTSGPSLQQVGVSSAVVAWTTTLPSSSVVKYGPAANDLKWTAEEPWGATAHKVELKNLAPGTRYYFSAHSAQAKNAPGQAIDTTPMPFYTRAAAAGVPRHASTGP